MPEVTGKELRLAVVGRPIGQSLSPRMHRAALRKLGLEGTYLRLAADSASEALTLADAVGIDGFNITAPFKEDFFTMAGTVSPAAEKLRAVNTFIRREDGWHAENTDVDGVALAVKKEGGSTRAVVLGAGGAARAAIQALLQSGISVTLANRSIDAGAHVAETFAVPFLSLEDPRLRQVVRDADLLVGTVSTDERVLPLEYLHSGLSVMDARYGHPTALVTDAQAAGCRVIDGRDWLLFQGARAFELFTGGKAPVDTMRTALSKDLPALRTVALVGLMGSGKTTVAPLLAAALGLRVTELDDAIVKDAGCSIHELMETRGEGHFRERESKLLGEALRSEGQVLSCGGGVIGREENRRLLQSRATVVWLWGSAKSLSLRLEGSTDRPLLAGRSHEQRLSELYAARIPLYADAADLVISTEGKSPEYLAERIADEVRRTWKD